MYILIALIVSTLLTNKCTFYFFAEAFKKKSQTGL